MVANKANTKITLSRIKTSDQVAFRLLFDQYFTWLISVAMTIVPKREDAEEVIEDVFVNLWNKRDKIDQIENIETYLYTAIKNSAYNYRKKYYKMTFNEWDDELDNREYSISPEEALIMAELKEKIDEAVSNLPKKCQEIFKFVRNEGNSHKKVAEKLNLSTKTIENQLGIAIKKIKSSLDKYLD